MSLAFPPVDIGPLALIALVPLFGVVVNCRPRRALLAGLGFGITFFGALLYWIRLFGPEAYVALVLLMTANIMVVIVVASLATRQGRPLLNAVVFAAAWTVGEYLRARFPFGGFAWGGIAYSQTYYSAPLQLASLTGAWGMSFMVALVSGLVAGLIGSQGRHRIEWLAGIAVVLFAPYLIPTSLPTGEEALLAIVQGNAPEGTFDPSTDDFEVLDNHARLTRQLPEIDLVIWPEQSVGRDPERHPSFARAISSAAQAADAPILAGTNIDVGLDRFRNTSAFWNAHGQKVGTYTKRHLVPFGEYFPGRSVLEPALSPFIEELALLPRDGIAGDEATTFEIPEGRFGSVICYESTFGRLVRDFVVEGARLIVVSTNNSSFERSAASDQHLEFSQIRAAEHRMWVAHAALTGISGVVAPTGRVLAQTELFTEDVLLPPVRFADRLTLYARWGDWFVAISALALIPTLVGALVPQRKGRQELRSVDEERPLVVIPTFNEAENIASLIEQIMEAYPGVSVLVVDDSSPDGTAEAVGELAASNARIKLLKRPTKRGLGTAYLDGFAWGLERDFTHFIEMDADFSHDPGAIGDLIAATDRAGLAIGTRYIEGGGVRGWSLPRLILSKAGNRYARFWLGFGLADSTSGFRCYRREVLEAIDRDSVASEGYAFQIDMAQRTLEEGFEVTEVPITFSERRAGGSKMSRRIVLEALVSVPFWGLRNLFQAHPGTPQATGSTESREET